MNTVENRRKREIREVQEVTRGNKNTQKREENSYKKAP